MYRKLVLATRNEYKARELIDLLHGLPLDIQTLRDYPNIKPVDEDGLTYKDNAVKKAVIIANLTGELTLGDDSGLEVTALSGKPGIHSSRFAPDDESRIRKLLQAMSTTRSTDRGAAFYCVVAIAEPHGKVWTVQGTCKGIVAPTPVGDNGFGYDPVFFYTELRKTFAQLNTIEKAQYSHRGKAMRNARIVLTRILSASASPILSEESEVQTPRYASIDIGTNCLRLLVAEWDKEQGLKPIIRHSEIVRLGQGMMEKRLSPGGIMRVYHQMDKYIAILKKHPVVDIFVGATSAVREALNQTEFLEEFYQKYNLRAHVLRGQEEATLTFLGVASDISKENIFVVDIGGGSTEFIQGKQFRALKEISLEFGSVRYTEKYIYHDPAQPAEIEAVVQHVRRELDSLEFPDLDSDYQFVGTGGTMTTISAMSQHMMTYESEKIHQSVVKLSDIGLLAEELANRSINERKELPGLDPNRADVILAGVLICREIMKKFGFDEMMVSERDLLDGLILSHLTLYRQILQ